MKLFAAAVLFTLTAQAASLTGKYVDDHGGTHLLSSGTWTMKGAGKSSTFIILENKKNTIIAHNANTNTFNPGKFSRFDIVKQADGSIAFCQTVADAQSQADAKKHAPANFKAKDGKGCGGFPFSIMKFASAKAAPAEAVEESKTTSGE